MQHCSGCGAANAAHVEICHSCRLPLDEHALQVYQSFKSETSRFDEFAAQVEAYTSGALSRAEFGNWVLMTRELMSNRRENYVEVIRETELEEVDLSQITTIESLDQLKMYRTGYFDVREEEVSTAMEGILAIESAIELMVAFAEDQSLDDSTLVAALEQMWQGNEKCNEAIRMNRVFREKLLSGDAQR